LNQRLYILCLNHTKRLKRHLPNGNEINATMSFARGVGHFQQIFDLEGGSPTNHCWCLKTTVIAVSCSIKISAVNHLVLSQYTRLTDGWTEMRQQYRALHYMQSHGKNPPSYKQHKVVQQEIELLSCKVTKNNKFLELDLDSDHASVIIRYYYCTDLM